MSKMVLVTCKDEVVDRDLLELKEHAHTLLGFVLSFCMVHNLPIRFTSIKSDNVTGRVSTSHIESRAFDLSIKNWPSGSAWKLCQEINEKYGYLGAYSNSDGKQRACVLHDVGQGQHLHIQCKRK